MNEASLDWLAEAISRHLMIRAQTRFRKGTPVQPFYGLDEGSAASILETIFEGLGYYTWREVKYQSDLVPRMDVMGRRTECG